MIHAVPLKTSAIGLLSPSHERCDCLQWGDEPLQVSLKLPEASKPAATSALPAASAAPAAPWVAAGSLPPPPGMPSSLPIAAAYGGYPPYDPYAAYAYYGYYADPYGYAAHADPYAAMAPANGTAAGAAEEDKCAALCDTSYLAFSILSRVAPCH